MKNTSCGQNLLYKLGSKLPNRLLSKFAKTFFQYFGDIIFVSLISVSELLRKHSFMSSKPEKVEETIPAIGEIEEKLNQMET